MADLANLDSLSGEDLTEEQIRGMIRKIDLNIANLANDGKLVLRGSPRTTQVVNRLIARLPLDAGEGEGLL